MDAIIVTYEPKPWGFRPAALGAEVTRIQKGAAGAATRGLPEPGPLSHDSGLYYLGRLVSSSKNNSIALCPYLPRTLTLQLS